MCAPRRPSVQPGHASRHRSPRCYRSSRPPCSPQAPSRSMRSEGGSRDARRVSIERVTDVANTQRGLITRRQALAAGLSAAGIRHRLETRRWQRLLPGIYAIFSGPIHQSHRTVAALLHAGPDALVTGALACALYNFVTVHRSTREPPNTRFLRHADTTPPGAYTGKPRTKRDPLVWLRSPDLVPAAPVERAVLDAVCARIATRHPCAAVRSGSATAVCAWATPG